MPKLFITSTFANSFTVPCRCRYTQSHYRIDSIKMHYHKVICALYITYNYSIFHIRIWKINQRKLFLSDSQECIYCLFFNLCYVTAAISYDFGDNRITHFNGKYTGVATILSTYARHCMDYFLKNTTTHAYMCNNNYNKNKNSIHSCKHHVQKWKFAQEMQYWKNLQYRFVKSSILMLSSAFSFFLFILWNTKYVSSQFLLNSNQ